MKEAYRGDRSEAVQKSTDTVAQINVRRRQRR
jgi:hypothetical protein